MKTLSPTPERTSPQIAGVALLLVSSVALGQPSDVEGSRDHPLISRIDGSTIRHYEEKAYDETVLLLGPSERSGEFADSRSVEGKLTRISYRLSPDASTLLALRAYERALDKAGFDVLFRCERTEECGRSFAYSFFQLPGESFENLRYMDQDARYLAAERAGPEGTVYVSLYTYERVGNDPFVEVRLRIVESEAVEELTVSVDAESIAREIEASGHVALTGILFDSDRAELKPASDPVLREMATYLQEHPEVRVLVVGHTDNVGEHEYNLELSRERAEAVVQALVSRFGIDADRLHAMGVGAAAPVASNRTEEGRAQNRRVELVER